MSIDYDVIDGVLRAHNENAISSYCRVHLMYRSDFNMPVKVDDGVKSCSSMFRDCSNFNYPVDIPDSVTDCKLMFKNCEKLNSPIKLSKSATNCDSMFLNCKEFNQPVVLTENIVFARNMFSGCFSFNQPVTLPESLIHCTSMFAFCKSFNQSVRIPENVRNITNMFVHCYSLNSEIILHDKITECNNALAYCSSFNTRIKLPYEMKHCYNMMFNCGSYNHILLIHSSLKPDDIQTIALHIRKPVIINNKDRSVTDDALKCLNANNRFIFTKNYIILISNETKLGDDFSLMVDDLGDDKEIIVEIFDALIPFATENNEHQFLLQFIDYKNQNNLYGDIETAIKNKFNLDDDDGETNLF